MPRTTTRDQSLDGTVLVPAGPFLFGEERSLTYLPPFKIGTYPVTVGAYAAFVAETDHALPDGWESPDGPADQADHPVTGVTYFDAVEYARWAGSSLPTEEQWEKAARGTDGREYPWGESFNVRALNSRAAKRKGTTPVTAYAGGTSPFGVWDMAGNVWEWTDTWYDLGTDLKVLKGGCHALTKEYAKATYRHYNDPSFGNNLTGFRIVECL